ncbi:MAG: RNB domain-containing ribonuclease [Actinobacteria bacterium]|nr:RNB domain-containing ribonuclease [Actinomycetota bacterium]
MISDLRQHRSMLAHIARRAMIERGLEPDFSAAALAELEGMREEEATLPEGNSLRDLRHLLWASIDNDDSRDLDQLTVAENLSDGRARILVAVADVDSRVKKDTAIDAHARRNTTSVYTAAAIFPMLPERLSTGLTSLNPAEDRVALVVDLIVGNDGSPGTADLYRALVHNHAKLAYNGVAAWLEGRGPAPQGVDALEGLAENLRLQDQVAQSMKQFRHLHGALSLETVEARPVFVDGSITELRPEEKNRAKELIEDFMIAANGATARFLSKRAVSCIRRVVRTPKRWDRIVEVAGEHGFGLPDEPDPKALEEFLAKAKAADPVRFPDLSLTIIKLLGPGEYVAERPGMPTPGHFGLAVRDYTHSTAPNRRFTDLLTQRLLKAALDGAPSPYSLDELNALALHCTQEENAANKVERQVEKSAAALLLQSRIGEQFDAIVTGAAAKGTWARLLAMPIEGRVVRGFEGLDVGHRIRVQLVSVDVERGFIDFKRVSGR